MATGTKAQVFGHFTHRTLSKSWKRLRHVIVKVLHKADREQRCRFLVTSLDWNSPRVIDAMREARRKGEEKEPRDLMPRVIYDAIYCPRGDMENRIKECQSRKSHAARAPSS
jgi:phosphatidylserine/phosphatidylglycerophosphate/cardiolipin synthase-like enzyme